MAGMELFRVTQNGEVLNLEVASLCFGCTETACYPLPDSWEGASRWSTQCTQYSQ